MRYCHFVLDPTKPGAIMLLQKINADLLRIGLEINSNRVLVYDEADAELMEKLKVIFDKYPDELNPS